MAASMGTVASTDHLTGLCQRDVGLRPEPHLSFAALHREPQSTRDGRHGREGNGRFRILTMIDDLDRACRAAEVVGQPGFAKRRLRGP